MILKKNGIQEKKARNIKLLLLITIIVSSVTYINIAEQKKEK